MRLGLIADIHGNHIAFRAVLQTLLDESDQILFLGDLCGYYPFVNECLSLWDKARIIGIRGNHDQVFIDCMNRGTKPDVRYDAKYGSALKRSLDVLDPSIALFFDGLPISHRISMEGVAIEMYHGSPWDSLHGRVYPNFSEWDRFNFIQSDVIVLGHTHYPLVKHHRNTLIVNPGSVGQPRDKSGSACCAVLDIKSASVKHFRIPFDSQRLIDDAQKNNPELPYLVEVLTR